MTKRKNNIHMLDGQQRKVLGQFQKDLQTAMPHMVEAAETAKRLHQAMIDAPFWRIAETPRPDTVEDKPELWSVGHAQVNYVDHIETEGTQPE